MRGAADRGDRGGSKSHRAGSEDVSCERILIFPRELSSFWQGAEYLEELLWWSCMKLKLLPRTVPHASL